MDKRHFCNVSVWVESGEELAGWLNAFVDDPAFFEESVYLTLLDNVDSEQTRDLLGEFSRKYPNNTQVLCVPELTYAAAYNAAAAQMPKCEFVNHTTTTAKLKVSLLRQMQALTAADKGIGVWSFYPVSVQPDGSQKAYLKCPAGKRKGSNSKYDRFSMYLPGYLIRSRLCLKHPFCETASEDADVEFLIRVIFAAKDYMLTGIPLVSEEPFENDFYNYRRQYNAEWYTECLRSVYLPLLQLHPNSPFVKTMVMYQIGIRFACNRNDRSKNILQGQALEEFFQVLAEVLGNIEDKYIAVYNINNMKMLPKYMSQVFLRLKYQSEDLMPTISTDGANHYVAVYHDALLDYSGTLKVSVSCMDYDPKKKELVIDGKLTNACVFNYDQIRCTAYYGQKKKPVTPNEVYSLEKYFGISMYRDYTFQVRFHISELFKATGGISFWLQYEDLTLKLPIVFPRMESRLVNEFPHSYWQFSKYIMTYNPKRCALVLNKRSRLTALKKELGLYKDFLTCTSGAERTRAVKSIALRMAYWLTRPFYRKKQIWLTFDQLFKGGDNGEYFFRYVADHHPDLVDMYYIANPDCADYKRLEKTYKNLLPFNSLKAKLIAMHATCVFATRVDVKQYCGFGPQLEAYHRGLLNYDVFCLQHGLTIQRIAQYQNRLFDNTKLYFCVSPNEVENLSHRVYGYDPEMLLLTGAPRYDPLISEDKRQILIAPTWRRNVTAGTNKKGKRHEYSINFKETEYYRIYNGLINNQKLIDCARETGYRIIYLVHPILSPQVGDFHGPEEVTILAGADGSVSYEQMMKESSLMLTDHSGIQFDFASMRKPLVYYHPDTLPPQYDAGGMDYETQAFGPVCRNEAEVVDALCRAMRRECRMEEEYRARADAFFAFDDHDNCKRIFEAAAKHQGLLDE